MSIKLGDIIIFVASLVLVIFSYQWFWQEKAQANVVEVYHGRALKQTLPLNISQIISVTGDIGKTTIEISQGRARFLEAPCKNQVCVHASWSSHTHDARHCLPNRISLIPTGIATPNHLQLDGVSH